MKRAWAATLLALGLLAGGGAGASADPPPPQDTAYREGRAHVEAGDRAFDAGDYARAAEEYLAAYQRIPLPDLLYNLGQCYRLANDRERAIDYYRRYLAVAPAGAAADKAREHIERMGGAATADSGSGAANATAPAGSPSPAAPAPAPEPTRGDRVTSRPRWLALGVAGAGLLAASGGVVLWLSADRSYDRLERDCAPGCEESDWQGARVRERTGIALAATGVAATAGGLLWWALSRRAGRPPAAAWAGRDAAGIALSGSF